MKNILNPVQLAILYSNIDPEKKGTQQTLQQRLIDEGEKVAQSTISYWIKRGYVPLRLANVVSKISGIPVEELTKNSPFKEA